MTADSKYFGLSSLDLDDLRSTAMRADYYHGNKLYSNNFSLNVLPYSQAQAPPHSVPSLCHLITWSSSPSISVPSQPARKMIIHWTLSRWITCSIRSALCLPIHSDTYHSITFQYRRTWYRHDILWCLLLCVAGEKSSCLSFVSKIPICYYQSVRIVLLNHRNSVHKV